MTNFFSENDFVLEEQASVQNWINAVIRKHGFEEGEITYIFCDDDYLLKLNIEFLDHDTLTDIISFDNRLGKLINGEIYISTERVNENAKELGANFKNELHRVMIHGILHFCGFKDKTETDALMMRKAEDESLSMKNFS